MKKKFSMLDQVGAYFSIHKEQIPDKGEDGHLLEWNEKAGILAVFDGCGGLGALTYPASSNKTGAYLASRAVSAAFEHWFKKNCEEEDPAWAIKTLHNECLQRLQYTAQTSGSPAMKMKGTMVKYFPTTVACLLFTQHKNSVLARSIWAGDSRTYTLTDHSLMQLTTDDLDGQDAYSNLSSDGVLTNVVSLDGDFRLHNYSFIISEPCIMLSATDGCFGYLDSPMAFEELLLITLEESKNMGEWKQQLWEEIAQKAGDDFSMTLCCFGFKTFPELQRYYKKRTRTIQKLNDKFRQADAEGRQEIWNEYARQYNSPQTGNHGI